MEVLAGAEKSIVTHKPILWIEVDKSDASAMNAWLVARGYEVPVADRYFLAAHPDDKGIEQFRAFAARVRTGTEK